MEPTIKRPSKLRIVLMWALMVGVIMFWVVFWLWREHSRMPQEQPEGGVVRSIFSLIVGGFFLTLGVASYLAVIFTGSFTFNYRQPVWKAVKSKQFLVNIIVTVLLALGAGFAVSAFFGPVLTMMGLEPGLANMLPVMLMVGVVQVMQLWVLIWSPVEKHIITKRLAALGITPAQLQSAALVGLSDPASGFIKRFGAIEEDMGALWVGPDQLIYWGDGEQFGISREQLVQMERRADNRSTSMLGGIAHIILHARLPDGGIRQIRLHTEGHWTMGRKRKAMDALAEAITSWHGGAGAAIPQPQHV